MAKVTDFRPELIYVLNEVRDEVVTHRVLGSPEMAEIPVKYVEKWGDLKKKEFQHVGNSMLYVRAPANILHGRSILYIRISTTPVVEAREWAGRVSMDVFKKDGARVFEAKLGGMCVFKCQYCYMYGANPGVPPVAIHANVS